MTPNNKFRGERMTGKIKFRFTVFLLFFFISIGSIIGSANANTGATDPSIIEGYVFDDDSSAPVENVTVDLLNESSQITEFTDINGSYRFTNLTEGNYTITFDAEYYVNHAQNITLEINQTQVINVSLTLKNTDSDPAPDINDPFPEDPDEWSDNDGDGVGNNSDDYPDDPSVSIDSDGDGYPDEWNEGYNHSPINESLYLDEVPNDPSASIDTDGDGFPDEWNEGYNSSPINVTLYIDEVPNDPRYSRLKDMDGQDGNGVDDDTSEEKDGGDSAAMTLICFPIIIIAGIIIVIVVIAGYTRLKSRRLLDHQTREKLVNYIKENPGIHYRGIMAALSLPMGTLTHHLNMLEKQEYIKSMQDGPYRRFYPVDHRIESNLLLTAPQQAILQQIKDNPGISQVNIADTLGMTKKTVYYNVGQLRDSGLVFVEKEGRESECFFAGET